MHRLEDTRVAKKMWRGFHRTAGRALPPADRLPLSTYFSSLKLRWLLQNIPEAQERPLRASCFLEIWIRSSSGT